MRSFCRDEGADLRKDGDQRILAQECRFTAHVRAGKQPDRAVFAALGSRQIAIIGDERSRRLASQGLFHHRMTPAADRKGHRGIDDRSAIGLLRRQIGKAGGDIDGGKCRRAGLDRFRLLHHGLDHAREGLQLHRQSLCGGIGDAAFEIGKLGGGEAHGARHGLAVDEACLGLIRRHHHIGVARRHLDEITQHVVVLDLQRLDAGLIGVFQLQTGDHTTRLVA